MIFFRFLIFTVLVICPKACCTLCAAVFILENGGHIEGLLLNPDQSPRKTYEIETKHGVRVTVDGHRVVKVIEPDPKKAPTNPAASPSKNRVATQEEIMKQRGYHRYKGRWLSQQEIDSLKKQQQRDAAIRGWYARIKRLSGQLGSTKSEEAQKALREINEPLAAAALAAALMNDHRRAAGLLYTEALFRLNTPQANRALALASLEHPDVEIRLNCLDFLKRRKDPAVVDFFASRLQHKNNAMINRAAVALRIMDDRSALPALIDALVTVHERRVTSGNSGQTSATFDNAGGGLSMGSTTKIYKIQVRNRDVLDALISLGDGVNFDFDAQAWRHWLALQQKHRPLDARRD